MEKQCLSDINTSLSKERRGGSETAGGKKDVLSCSLMDRRTGASIQKSRKASFRVIQVGAVKVSGDLLTTVTQESVNVSSRQKGDCRSGIPNHTFLIRVGAKVGVLECLLFKK